MRPIRAVLIDIDGVLTLMETVARGGRGAATAARGCVPAGPGHEHHIPDRASIASALAEAGFPVSVGDILVLQAADAPW